MKSKMIVLALALGVVLYIQFCVDLKEVIKLEEPASEEAGVQPQPPE